MSGQCKRVIEIPVLHRTLCDARRLGVKPDSETTMVFQERACTSPIWYTPKD